MKRRESLQRISTFLGLAVYLPSLAGLLEGCSAKEDPLWVPIKISKKQQSMISTMADMIIPETDTPGATDADVPAFIEVLLQDVFERRDARGLLKDLENFNEECKSETGCEFLICTTAQKVKWMEAVAKPSHGQHTLFRKMNELVVGAYFTSEVGVKQNLHYLPIPGKFEACRKLEEFNRVIVGDRI